MATTVTITITAATAAAAALDTPTATMIAQEAAQLVTNALGDTSEPATATVSVS
jgi:hypothetical protein